MDETSEIQPIPSSELKSLVHPSEGSRFAIAVAFSLFLLAILVISVIDQSVQDTKTFIQGRQPTDLDYVGNIVIDLILFFAVLAGFAGLYLLAVKALKASLLGNSVRISEENFPQIHAILTEVRRSLNYDKPVDVFVVEEGSINPILYIFLQANFITLPSAVVHDTLHEGNALQLKWMVARFVGALKVKQVRLRILSLLTSYVEKFVILNLFVRPYERATQYSGDQIGLVVCGDLESAVIALNKLLAGRDLAESIQIEGIISQAREINGSFLGWIAQLLSSHPHTTNRFLNLLSFAKNRYPHMYETYISRLDSSAASKIEGILS